MADFARRHLLTAETVADINRGLSAGVELTDPAALIPAGTVLRVMRVWTIATLGEKLTSFVPDNRLYYCARHACVRTVGKLLKLLYEAAYARKQRGEAPDEQAVNRLLEVLKTKGVAEVGEEEGVNGKMGKLVYNMSDGTISEQILAVFAQLVAAVYLEGKLTAGDRVQRDKTRAAWAAYLAFNQL